MCVVCIEWMGVSTFFIFSLIKKKRKKCFPQNSPGIGTEVYGDDRSCITHPNYFTGGGTYRNSQPCLFLICIKLHFVITFSD